MQQAVLVLDLGLVLRSRLELADVMAVKVGADEQSFTLHTRKSAETFVCLQRADLLGDPHGHGWQPAFSSQARQVYVDDRAKLQARTRAALGALAASPMVDASRLALIAGQRRT